ncbi:MAG TPA: hypothetical protein VNV38_13640 [Stellaceae bacterium]|jgi:hypothetical protein|nr:hypothetical protein [Stellaceae bacterium]
MSKLGAVFLTGLIFATPVLAAAPPPVAPATPLAAAAAHHIGGSAAWGCRAKHDVFDILFLGLSASFDTKLADALTDGRCVFFQSGETVTILESTGSHGLVKIQRGTESTTYWTPLRNVE